MVAAIKSERWPTSPRKTRPTSIGNCRLGEVEGDPTTLLRPAQEDVLRIWPVNKKVGNVRNDGPDLIEPVAEVEPTLL
jgi:hypothetical protein